MDRKSASVVAEVIMTEALETSKIIDVCICSYTLFLAVKTRIGMDFSIDTVLLSKQSLKILVSCSVKRTIKAAETRGVSVFMEI